MIDLEREAEGEAGSMQGARRGLDPGTPGSRPGPEAGAKPLSNPGIPSCGFLKRISIFAYVAHLFLPALYFIHESIYHINYSYFKLLL